MILHVQVYIYFTSINVDVIIQQLYTFVKTFIHEYIYQNNCLKYSS